MINQRESMRLPAAAKADLTIMLLAKHACSDGGKDALDGNHAVYHHELRETLRAIGLNVVVADSYEAVIARPEADFVIPLLNRGGFQNSEMLAPLLLQRHGLPFLGASPIVRGFTDDKHLSKVVARHAGVPTMDWQIHRIGGLQPGAPAFAWERLVVKPNASSASWGIRVVDSWAEAHAHIAWLHREGHDVIVEPWVPLIDIALPVVGGANGPWMLPPMAYLPEDPTHLRSYEEKRALTGDTSSEDPLSPVEDPLLRQMLEAHGRRLLAEMWPFDYGRFEFRFDPATGALRFMEVNLSCNLWSKKTISRSAATLGVDHAELVESIVAHSLERQGLLTDRRESIAA
ncbi:phosphoribosylglycinamide synthetase [Sphingobium boeckii]|uniref:D-alanine-D-alanine ligase n=1 Tax=Sphingobium boeckii TaxID=1082345 RepID=A0A7W9AG79_9SPHN|nr:phosphoribosylglycinamide synthetase [Sphingobium boeckii]MBB5685072.1 D-alanine-D-alanine ligase [Sphingobium boeckii]